MKKYCILGTDNRSLKLRELYNNDGINLVSYDVADIVIAPIPFSKDDIKINGELLECDVLINTLSNNNSTLFTGHVSSNMQTVMNDKGLNYYDLLKYDQLAILNAIPTAEGAIYTAIGMTDFTLNGSNILVLGFGRIGKVIAKMLSGFGANIYCEARKPKDIAMIKAMGYSAVELENLDIVISKMDIIFNTIPYVILDEKKLNLLKSSCAIIDLASYPGGTDFLTAKDLNLNVNWALALPSKVAPLSAAGYIKNIVEKILKNDDMLEIQKNNLT